jgi:hypothetical protein
VSGSIAAIVAYSSPLYNLPVEGFSLNWQGNSFDPLQTKHISFFSSNSSGKLNYPAVVGEHYDTNVALTWLISPNEESKSDLDVKSIQLESPCSNPDPCTCDASILYEIDGAGVLRENGRICGDITDGRIVQNVESQFIFAFFSDSQRQSEDGFGIQAEYYPAGITTPTPSTTTIRTTTSLPPDVGRKHSS